MTIDEIRELIRVVQDTGILELEFQQGESRVRIRRAPPATQEVVMSTAAAVTPGTTPPPIAAPPAEIAETTRQESDNDVTVKSPIVGTYYDAPAPGSPPFVKVGDFVKEKQVLCIIESMKLMNEIEAETAGTLMSKLVENGRPVEYGESLFSIRPAQ